MLPPDFDSDPARWASHDRSTYLRGDVHQVVAEQIVRRDLRPVLDVGCGKVPSPMPSLPAGRGSASTPPPPSSAVPFTPGEAAA